MPYQSGDINIKFKTDRITLWRLKGKLLFQNRFSRTNKRRNEYEFLLHTGRREHLLLVRYKNKGTRFNLNTKKWINLSPQSELITEIGEIMGELIGNRKWEVIKVDIYENKIGGTDD